MKNSQVIINSMDELDIVVKLNDLWQKVSDAEDNEDIDSKYFNIKYEQIPDIIAINNGYDVKTCRRLFDEILNLNTIYLFEDEDVDIIIIEMV